MTVLFEYLRFAWIFCISFIINILPYMRLHAKCDFKNNKNIKCPFTLYDKSKRQQKQFKKRKMK
jgi:hypothetical protein